MELTIENVCEWAESLSPEALCDLVERLTDVLEGPEPYILDHAANIVEEAWPEEKDDDRRDDLSGWWRKGHSSWG